MDAEERACRARENFTNGYNCAQSVAMAFADVFGEQGVSPDVVARLSSPFGGGMGRLREVCGAVSAMLMVLGVVEGYDDPTTFDAKMELYQKVQRLAGEYRAQNGSIICRELLGLDEGPSEARPERRTDEYYKRRPCAELCASAARTLAEYLGE